MNLVLRKAIRQMLFKFMFYHEDIAEIERSIKLKESSPDRLFKAQDYSATDGSQKSINPKDSIGDMVCKVHLEINELVIQQLEIDRKIKFINIILDRLTDHERCIVKLKYFIYEQGVKHDNKWLSNELERTVETVKRIDKNAITKFEKALKQFEIVLYDEDGKRVC